MSKQNFFKNKKILFLYKGGHPVHLSFAKAINADIKKISWSIPKGYDIYISESDYLRPAILKILKRFNKSSKIIGFFADPRLYYLNKKRFFDVSKKKIRKYPSLKRWISIYLLKKLDGAICIGKFERDLFHNFCKKIPVIVIYGFVGGKKKDILQKISPNLSSNNILYIGNGPDYYCKGLDIARKSFKNVFLRFPEKTFTIVGKWDLKSDVGEIFVGQQNIERYLKNASLVIHPGRGDTFPVSTIESMMAGIPIIVSKETGTKEIVEKVEREYIVDLDSEQIAKKIIRYLELPLINKKKISSKFRKIAKNFEEKKILNYFKQQFFDFLEEIYKQKI